MGRGAGGIGSTGSSGRATSERRIGYEFGFGIGLVRRSALGCVVVVQLAEVAVFDEPGEVVEERHQGGQRTGSSMSCGRVSRTGRGAGPDSRLPFLERTMQVYHPRGAVNGNRQLHTSGAGLPALMP